MAETFQTLNVYDAPGLALSQLGGGVASWASLRDSVFGPDRLSPEERKTLADRMGAPEGGVLRAVAEAATNPWVWALFLMAPVGARALAGGKSFFAQEASTFARKSAPLMKEVMSSLEVLNDTGYQHVQSGVANLRARMIEEDVKTIGPSLNRLMAKIDGMVPGAEAGKWAEGSAVDILNPVNYPAGSVKRGLLERYQNLSGAVTAGVDRASERTVKELSYDAEVREAGGQWRKVMDDPLLHGTTNITKAQIQRLEQLRAEQRSKAKDAWFALTGGQRKRYERQGIGIEEFQELNSLEIRTTVPQIRRSKTILEPALVDADLRGSLQAEFGDEGMDLLRMQDYARRRMFVRYLGDLEAFDKSTTWRGGGLVDKAGDFVIDREKVRNVLNDIRRQYGPHPALGEVGRGSTSPQGMQILTEILGNENMDHLRMVGTATQKGWEEAVIELVSDAVSPDAWNSDRFYYPRNTYSLVKVGGKTPTLSLDQVTRAAIDNQPMLAGYLTKHIAPITEKDLWYDPDWLTGLGENLTEEGKAHVRAVQTAAHKTLRDDGRGFMALRPNSQMAHGRYVDSMSVATALSSPADDAALAADASLVGKVPESTRNRWTHVGGGVKVKVGDVIPKGMTGKPTYADLTERIYQRLDSSAMQAYLRDTGLPSMVGQAGPEYLAMYNAGIAAKEQAGWFVNTRLAEFVEKRGGEVGKRMIGRLREYADFDRDSPSLGLGHGLAKWLYASHLWFNNSSVMLNMMQPLTLTAVGARADDVMSAYAESLQQTSAYMVDRAKRGLAPLGEEAEMGIIRKHFPMAAFGPEGKNLIGVTPDANTLLDAHMRGGGSLFDKVGRAGMFLFQNSEFHARNTAALVMKKNYQRVVAAEQGITTAQVTDQMLLAKPHFISDAERFQMQVSFGQNDANTPGLFLRAPFNMPLFRQFLTFPIRTTVGAFRTFPLAGEQTYGEGLARTMLRGMGMSALVYEVGKHTIGADLSSGLFASSVFDVVGGSRIARDGEGAVVPLPPVVSVPIDLARGVMGQDYQMVAGALARAVPGGMALQKALSVAPELDGPIAGVPGMVQKTYADYGQRLPTGEVPVYKEDGTFIGYRSPTDLVLRGLGVDMGRWQNQGQLDGYLVKQRDVILGYRKKYLDALAGNDPGRADEIRKEFSRKFKGVPLTVSKEQVRSFLESKSRVRSERVLNYVPPEVRWQYAKMLEGRVPNLRQGAFSEEVGTSRDRDAFRQNAVTEEQVRSLIQRSQSPPEERGSFSGFQAFQ